MKFLKNLRKKRGREPAAPRRSISILAGLLLGFIAADCLQPRATPSYGLKNMLTHRRARRWIANSARCSTPTAPLIDDAVLSVGFAFKTGLFNIGASGQYDRGRVLRADGGHSVPDCPGMCADTSPCMIGGALWGAIPGLFKALLQRQRGHYRHHVQLDRPVRGESCALNNMPMMLANAWGAGDRDRTARPGRRQLRDAIMPKLGLDERVGLQLHEHRHLHRRDPDRHHRSGWSSPRPPSAMS